MSQPYSLRPIHWISLAVLLALLAYGLHLVLIAPVDANQGNIGSMLFYHVPMQVWGLTFPFVNLIGAVGFLYFRNRDAARAALFDAVAVASAEVTVLFITVGTLSGMLWAKPVWGIWWTWDERLTTELLLWLIYVSYQLIRRFANTGQVQAVAAVLSVFAAIDVPIVYYSTQWWRTQHPSPVFFSPDPNAGLDKSMKPAFDTNFIAWLLWGVFLISIRYLLERRRQQAAQVQMQAAIAATEVR